MEKYYKCNKCGNMIVKDITTPSMCVNRFYNRRICGGSFTIELTKEEVIDHFKKWGYSEEDINYYFNGKK